jgi:NAD(P)-dependent dehydrogenase (short-subunit alcohol dehydrogenase family)
MRALIVGGNGDIARAVAGQLRERGWEVDAPGRGDIDVREDVPAQWVGAHYDAVVYCAGIARWTTRERDMLEQFDVNAVGAFRVTRAVRAARYIYVTSELAEATSLPLAAAGYAMSKAALNVLARAFATERPGVIFRALCPGKVRTKMNPSGNLNVDEGASRIVQAVIS